MIPPYVQNPETGASKTREFVLAFLQAWSHTDADSSRSIFDTVYGANPMVMEALYAHELPQPLKNYIKRVAHTPVSKNTQEIWWCLLADISSACKRLDNRTRLAMGLRYCRDWQDYTIAETLNVSERTVDNIIQRGVTQVANMLDRVEDV